MPDPPEQKPAPEPITEKRDERNAWSDEQNKHDYYYDDSHGYETYEPDEDDETGKLHEPQRT